jgi:hypothetical protein
MSQVKITALNGKVFTPNANLGKHNKQYGFIRVQSTIVDMSGPVARVKTISALKSILESDYNKAKDILIEGTVLPGKIIVKETTTAGLPGYQPKMAGSDSNAVPCLLGGAQIYRTTEFTSDVNASDVLVAHDNIEAIRNTQKEALAADSLNK